MNADLSNSVLSLSPAEKLQLVEDIWDSLAISPKNIPLLDWQKQELDRRSAEYENNPETGFTWEKVKAFARNRHPHD